MDAAYAIAFDIKARALLSPQLQDCVVLILIARVVTATLRGIKLERT